MLIALLFPGRRWYPFGYRVHHFHTGLALLACGVATRNRRLIWAGVALCVDDCPDWRAGLRFPRHRRYETA